MKYRILLLAYVSKESVMSSYVYDGSNRQNINLYYLKNYFKIIGFFLYGISVV